MAEAEDPIIPSPEKRQKVDEAKPDDGAEGAGGGGGNGEPPPGKDGSLAESLNGVWNLLKNDEGDNMTQAKVSELEQQRRTSECRLEIRTKPNKKQQARIFCGQSLPFLAEEFKTLFTIDEAGCITGADGRQKFPFYMRITDPFENLYGFDRMEGWVWIKQTQWTDSRGSPVLEGGFDFDLHHSFDSKGLPNPYGRALESCLAFKSHDEEVGADEWELLYEADEQ